MIVLSLVSALALGAPIPPPAPGQEAFSEVIDALREGPKDPERLRALHARGAAQATAPPYAAILRGALNAELEPVPADRPLPARLPRLKPDAPEVAWLQVAAAGASLSYEPAEAIRARLKRWGYRKVDLFENSVPGTRAFVAARDDHVLVAFTGTEAGVADPVVDLSLDQVRAGRYGGGYVHRGFETALASIWPELEAALERARKYRPERPTLFTGHSLGGALATLAFARGRAAMRYPRLSGGAPSARLVSFGAPRVGDEKFAALPIFSPASSLRVVHRHDPVPHALARGLGYRHPARARTLWIDDARVLQEIPAEDPARDELPQDLDLQAIGKWIDEGKVRFEDHNESNYTVLLGRLKVGAPIGRSTSDP